MLSLRMPVRRDPADPAVLLSTAVERRTSIFPFRKATPPLYLPLATLFDFLRGKYKYKKAQLTRARRLPGIHMARADGQHGAGRLPVRRSPRSD